MREVGRSPEGEKVLPIHTKTNDSSRKTPSYLSLTPSGSSLVRGSQVMGAVIIIRTFNVNKPLHQQNDRLQFIALFDYLQTVNHTLDLGAMLCHRPKATE